ncbi:MAG TPA: maleylpyruvate isomerase N-terminal domain-containing protein, partial [Acidimicrobiia bacterium]|nr:maleylpyruvate isomerase N-terminal domain-containing protein [Acidimicrobiia bacterium]
MELEFGTVRKALRAQCEVISRLLLNLPEQEFARPTRLQPWDVHHLVAHLYRDLERVPLALQERGPAMSADTDV